MRTAPRASAGQFQRALGSAGNLACESRLSDAYRMNFTCLIALVRCGFEPDAVQELNAWLQPRAPSVVATFEAPGVVLLRGSAPMLARAWEAWRDWRCEAALVREFLAGVVELAALPRGQRVEVLLAAWPDAWQVQTVELLAPDSEAGRLLAPMLRAVQRALHSALSARFVASASASAYALFLTSERCILALAVPGKSAPVLGGIPRLKFPAQAPSRSTLKLDEAFLTLLDERERGLWLRPGMRAVDLGAAPGGWTYQLVRRGIHVVAIDNGALAGSLLSSGLVTHLREDGFRYAPKKPVDWLVCDMVEKPLKVAELAAHWFKAKYCRHAVVNLKLPMKRRVEELQRCRAALQSVLGARGIWRCKQLYHDREEVTALISAASS